MGGCLGLAKFHQGLPITGPWLNWPVFRILIWVGSDDRLGGGHWVPPFVCSAHAALMEKCLFKELSTDRYRTAPPLISCYFKQEVRSLECRLILCELRCFWQYAFPTPSLALFWATMETNSHLRPWYQPKNSPSRFICRHSKIKLWLHRGGWGEGAGGGHFRGISVIGWILMAPITLSTEASTNQLVWISQSEAVSCQRSLWGLRAKD